MLKKGSDPLETVLNHSKNKRSERVRPLFQPRGLFHQPWAVRHRGSRDRKCVRHAAAQATRLFFFLLFSTGSLLPAQTPPARSDGADAEFFESRIRPLLIEQCGKCHAGPEQKGGLRLDSREAWMRGGDSGPAIVPGSPDESLLIRAVAYDDEHLQMPPKGKLDPRSIADLVRWVQRGAFDPRSTSPRADRSGSDEPVGMSLEEGREFWSFTPVRHPTPPAFHASEDTGSWIRTPVDNFVLAKLREQNLHPAPPATKETLIRRVTFDLIGMPPTVDEVDAFLNDDSPRAFDRVIERLLASPRYGERWGRHWLDVARYADSNGLDENLALGNAWRYRDYVIDSFNRDKPLDRFVIEQLAGDLMPGANRESVTATGFLALGAKVLAEPDREKLAMDAIDEQLDTIGKSFLGMTFGCVRCHDHKFDPLTQADYYALAAIFKSTRSFGDTNTGAIKHWYEHSFASEQQLERVQAADKSIAEAKKRATDYKNQAMATLRDEARGKATDYLVACTSFEPTAPLTEVRLIAERRGLYPRILHHCRLHLHYKQDEPPWVEWHQRRSDPTAIRRHYQTLFTEAEAALAKAREINPKAKKVDDERLEMARSALYDATGFLAVPPKPEFAFSETTLQGYNELMEDARLLESRSPDEPASMGVADGDVVDSIPIHIRGSHLNLGRSVSREFPAVMRTSRVRPIFREDQSGRLELARWIAGTQHPLTARVFVNRLWGWHFGQGIVRTTENFGVLGDRPSHPDLLEWLAHRFMQSGWSVKQMHRVILRSSTYQMSAQTDESTLAIDPENRLLARFKTRRMDAEQIRDALLAVSGRIDGSAGGKTVPLRNRQFVFNHTSVDHTRYDLLRRAVYLPVIRNNLYSMFREFDFPDPTMPTGHRQTTVVAPQSLWMMNAPLVMDSADALAEVLIRSETDDLSRLRLLYRRALGRPPSRSETDRALAFLAETTSMARTGSDSVDDERVRGGWALLCHGVFASNEFIYLR